MNNNRFRDLLRPVANRIANSIARAVVTAVDDKMKIQLLQIGVLSDETIDDAEHHQPYGFSSVPFEGAESVVLFPGGDRSHPLVVVTSDRRYRPTNGQPGEVTIYHRGGAKIVLLGNGNIEAHPGPSGTMFIRDENGSADRLVKKSEFDGHTHAPGTFIAPSGGGSVVGISGGAPAVSGTQRLRAQ